MSPLEIALVAVWTFTVSFGGGLVGLVLGNLRLPMFVAFGSGAAAAAGANVAVSGAAAFSAALAHWRGGRIDGRLFLWMAPASLVGAAGGGLLAGVMPERPLLGVISLVVLYGAVEVSRYRAGRAMVAGAPPESGSAGTATLLLNGALVGLVVGAIGGMVGLILGSLRLPALLKYVGVTPAAAAGTNAAVGAVVGFGGLLGHLPSGVDWDLVAVGAAAAIPGALLGARLTGRLDEARLLRAMAAVLIVSGLALAVSAVLS